MRNHASRGMPVHISQKGLRIAAKKLTLLHKLRIQSQLLYTLKEHRKIFPRIYQKENLLHRSLWETLPVVILYRLTNYSHRIPMNSGKSFFPAEVGNCWQCLPKTPIMIVAKIEHHMQRESTTYLWMLGVNKWMLASNGLSVTWARIFLQ